MSNATRSADAGDPPVNPYDLLGAVNASSQPARRSWAAFAAVWAYLMLVVASVTHRDLLLANDVTLPLLAIKLPLTWFFVVAPVVVLVLHLGLSAQLLVLAKKASALDRALRMLEATDLRTHPLRLEVSSFSPVQVIAGPERHRALGGLLHAICWLVVAALPIGGLLYVQAVFLPYHDPVVTWVHRSLLLADVVALMMVGVFLLGEGRALGETFRSAVRLSPVRAAAGGLLGALVAAVSVSIITMPGEVLQAPGSALARAPALEARERSPDTAERALFGLVRRNLDLRDLDLSAAGRLHLRHRDLRLARFDRSRMPKADLAGANLDGTVFAGADLSGASLGCSRDAPPADGSNAALASCASARRADFSRARMIGADLSGLDLGDANLAGVDLTGARLADASLIRADLSGAWLEKVDLSGARLQGANLTFAALSGADLSRADLAGANLTNATLRGTILANAGLEGTTLAHADLEAAALGGARLFASDLSGSRLRAASLRGARVWRTLPPSAAETSLVDFSGVDSAPPGKSEREAILVALRASGEASRKAAIERLTSDREPPAAWQALRATGNRSDPGKTTVTGALVPTGARISGPDVASLPVTGDAPSADQRLADRRADLTRYLVEIACVAPMADGAVATGVARRAMRSDFDGDPAKVLESLRKPECRGGLGVPPAVMTRLTHAVARLNAR